MFQMVNSFSTQSLNNFRVTVNVVDFQHFCSRQYTTSIALTFWSFQALPFIRLVYLSFRISAMHKFPTWQFILQAPVGRIIHDRHGPCKLPLSWLYYFPTISPTIFSEHSFVIKVRRFENTSSNNQVPRDETPDNSFSLEQTRQHM